MIRIMAKRLFGIVRSILLLVALLVPAAALARSDEAPREPIDARLEGYPQNVTLDGNSAGGVYVAMVFLGLVCFAGLFKDARRTHLD